MDLLFKSNMENHRLLASAALFRGMYTEQLDQYDVLADFIKATVALNGLHIFDVTLCTSKLKDDFGFEIPEAVVRNCIKSKLKLEFKRIPRTLNWQQTEKFIPDQSLRHSFLEAQKAQNSLTLRLITHAEREQNRHLSESEKSELIDDFYSHLKGLPRQNHNFPYIAHLILSLENDTAAKQILEHTRQGLIIFDGLRYSAEATGATLSRSLVIYLDTEVLFSAGGLHGELRQQLYYDFNSLVIEIIQKSKKSSSRVELRYFDETAAEIESYFSAAEAIANRQTQPIIPKQAMMNILNGCTNGADVLAKKVKFLQQLNKLKITQEVSRNYYDPPTYNIESEATLSDLTKELSCETDRAAYALKQFSRINFMRTGDNKTSLGSVGFIFLSEKTIIRSAAFSETVSKVSGGGIPFATDLDYMTEWLWFKLNKGFCTASHIPAAFDVIARTRIALSAQLSSKVANEYRQLVEEHSKENSSINEEILHHYIIELMSKVRQPEEINNDSIDLEFLANDDFVTHAVAEHTALKLAAAEGRLAQENFDQFKTQSSHVQNQLQSKISTLQKTNETMQRIQHFKDLRYRRRERNKPYIYRAAYFTSAAKILYWALPLLLICTLILYLKSAADTWLSVFSTFFTVIPVVVSVVLLIFNGRFRKYINHLKRRYLSSRLERRSHQAAIENQPAR